MSRVEALNSKRDLLKTQRVRNAKEEAKWIGKGLCQFLLSV